MAVANIVVPFFHRGVHASLEQWRGTMCNCCDGRMCDDCEILIAIVRIQLHGIPAGWSTYRQLVDLCPWMDCIFDRIEAIQCSNLFPVFDCNFTPGIIKDGISKMHAIFDVPGVDQEDHMVAMCRTACTLYGTCSHRPEVIADIQREELALEHARAERDRRDHEQKLRDEAAKESESIKEDRVQEMAMWYIKGERPRHWDGMSV
jgi:hypothetical protein